MADLRDTILARVNIAEAIGQYVSLTQAGREFKARCPFHEEKAASFHVNPEKGLFHCFGCKAGGNVIDFIMRIENLEFVEALEWLANRYHIEVPRTPGERQQRGRKERLYQLNEAALKFFRSSLKAPAGDTARAYLAKRGLAEATVAEFELGYAPREWSALLDKLTEHGARSEELVALGLIKERRGEGGPTMDAERRHYDTFRHRLMFPIRSAAGRLLGFAGRALSDEDTPKYLNVTNTPLYDKSSVVYNLSNAKGHLRDQGALVVEGYMDVIGLAQAGVGNAVATCGTALTEEHVALLKRYTERFFLAFDGDEGGRRAAWSAGQLFLRAGLACGIALLPEGMDPDDFIREHGPEGWGGLLANAVSPVRFWLEHQRAQFPEPDVAAKRAWIRQLGALFRVVPDELSRQEFAREVASALRLGGAEVAGLLAGIEPERAGGVRLRSSWRPQRRRGANDYLAPELYPREGDLVAELLTGEALDKARRTAGARQWSLIAGPLAVEREVTRRLLSDEEFRYIYLALAQEEDEAVRAWFADPLMRELFEQLLAGGAADELVQQDRFRELSAGLLNAEPARDSHEQLLTRHRNGYYERRVQEVSAELRRAIDTGDAARQAELSKQLVALKREIKPVRALKPTG